jgi:D-alanyl-D-alanine carboxypeptidase
MMGKNNKQIKRKLRPEESNDIPEVIRDRPSIKVANRPGFSPLLLASLTLGILALLSLLIFWRPSSQPVAISSPPLPTPTSSATPGENPGEEVDNVLGHLPYAEAPQSELKAITPDGRLRMRTAAANEFLQMQGNARAEGVILVPISAFRSVQDQNQIFFGVKQQRNQQVRQRAEVSAPPGYSEHHTGYAIDIGDGRAPGTNLSQNFETTAAYKWLKNHAAQYNFENSFTRDNAQGVSYEPWHWRYVGDRQSLETFFKARSLNTSSQPAPAPSNP